MDGYASKWVYNSRFQLIDCLLIQHNWIKKLFKGYKCFSIMKCKEREREDRKKERDRDRDRDRER